MIIKNQSQGLKVMFKSLKKLILLFFVVSLSACGHYSEDMASFDMSKYDMIAPAAGNDFSLILSQKYMDLAQEENAKYDYVAARYFTDKAMQANRGRTVGLAKLSDFNIHEKHHAEAKQLRNSVEKALHTQKSPENYAHLATAQTQFDSWLEQLEEGHQKTDIQSCHEKLDQALAMLENPLPTEVNYTLYFGENSAAIGAVSKERLQEVVSYYEENPFYMVTIIGFTNNLEQSGANNDRLAIDRAHNIRSHLVQAGVPAGKIYAYTQKEQAVFQSAANPSHEAGKANVILRLRPRDFF